MILTNEELRKIIQEELKQNLTEQEMQEIFNLFGKGKKARQRADAGWKAAEDFRTDFKKSLGLDKPKNKTQDKTVGIQRTKHGPGSPNMSKLATTSNTQEPVSATKTSTSIPISGDVSSTATSTTALSPQTSQPEKKINVNILAPIEDEPAEKPSGQMDLFGDYAAKVKKDEESKQTWQKMFDSAKNEPNQTKAIERLKAIADSSQAHPDIKKQAKQLVDRYLNESKNIEYNKTYENWKRFVKG